MDIGQEIPGRGMKKRDATKLIHNIYTFAKMRLFIDIQTRDGKKVQMYNFLLLQFSHFFLIFQLFINLYVILRVFVR